MQLAVKEKQARVFNTIFYLCCTIADSAKKISYVYRQTLIHPTPPLFFLEGMKRYGRFALCR